jgi:hypothetical protein
MAGLLAAAALVAGMPAGAEDVAPPTTGEPSRVATAAGGIRVRATLAVTGELVMPIGGDAAPRREPVEMEARFDFDEWPALAQGGAAAGSAGAAAPAVRRSYRQAAAAMRIGEATTRTALAEDARDLLVAKRGTTPLPYLADGFLSGEESDLLEIPFDALLLDELLPREAAAAVAVGDAWQIAGDLTAGLLAIDTIESGGLEARIERFDEGLAEVGVSGLIDGAVDGVPTHVTVEGRFMVPASKVAGDDESADGEAARFRLHGPVSRVAVVILERRQASHVAPGFEVEARVLVERTPLDGRPAAEPVHVEPPLAEPTQVGEELAPAPRRRGAGGPGQIWYRDPQGRFDLVHDMRWRRVENGANGLVMRLVDRGALVGQCSITSLPQAPSAALPSRADVQADIERTLAGQIDRIDAAEETDRPDGLRVVRVVSSGTAGRLPFRRIHYILAARDGSRTNVTFMCEASMQERFADADRSLVESLRLPAGRTATAPRPVRQ